MLTVLHVAVSLPWGLAATPVGPHTEGEATVERAEIDVIKVLHRPHLHWRNAEVFSGCSCGRPYYPCEKLTTARAAERNMIGSVRNVGRYPS